MSSHLMLQAMKAASKELRTAFKRDELNISGIEKMQDEMADIMVPISGTVIPFLHLSLTTQQSHRQWACSDDMLLWGFGHATHCRVPTWSEARHAWE